MHPRKEITQKYPNPENGHTMDDLVVVKYEKRIVSRKEQMCIFFRHDDFPNQEIYCTRRWVKVIAEGHKEHFFDLDGDLVHDVENSGTPVDGVEVPESVRGRAEDIQAVRALGLDVDDDNDPAPENVPRGVRSEDDPYVAHFGQWHGIDHRKAQGIGNVKPKVNRLPTTDVAAYTSLQVFCVFFPMAFLTQTIIGKTNENLKKKQKEATTLGEFLRFLGLWFFMATLSGYAKRQYWSTSEVNEFDGAPYRLHKYMSYNRFMDILSCLGYTMSSPPNFVDKFWEIRDLVKAWNANMKEVFVPSWVSCLDESMSIWFNKFTCPGWTFVPRKPHPFGNEYHSICCGLSGIMYAIEMKEGKDRPKDLPQPSFEEKGKTGGLLMRLCSALYGTGKVVILDSGFCVLQALIELKKVGVYAGAVIKKRKYWPRYIRGAAIEEHMKEKDVGDADVAVGTLDDISYNVFAMKEPEYVMKLMATYGELTPAPDQEKAFRQYEKNNQTIKKQFCYPPPIANHFWYRHAVDDHNNLRHKLPSIEDTWRTSRWSNRVFSCVLAFSEVNAYLFMKYFVWKDRKHLKTLHQFRRDLAEQLINNDHYRRERPGSVVRESRRLKRTREHTLCTAPPGAKRFKGADQWEFGATKYNQLTCTTTCCPRRVRTYCSCSPGVWLCQNCHENHCRVIYSSDETSD